MHELSMAHAVVRTVADAVPGRAVTTVTLRVGVASGVVPGALTFAWDVATAGSDLAGSRLVIERVPLGVHCADCGQDTTCPDGVHVRCGGCGGRRVEVTSGEELEIATVEVSDDPPVPAADASVEVDAAEAGPAALAGGVR